MHRVAVAEDDADMRGLIADALRREGYSVVEAADGAALRRALGDASEAALELVISDVCMPVVTGLAVLREIRESGSTLPVVLMTGFGDDSVRQEAVGLGAVLFNKPFQLADLRALVRAVFSSPANEPPR